MTKGTGIIGLPAIVTLLPYSHFTSEHRKEAQNSKENTLCTD